MDGSICIGPGRGVIKWPTEQGQVDDLLGLCRFRLTKTCHKKEPEGIRKRASNDTEGNGWKNPTENAPNSFSSPSPPHQLNSFTAETQMQSCDLMFQPTELSWNLQLSWPTYRCVSSTLLFGDVPSNWMGGGGGGDVGVRFFDEERGTGRSTQRQRWMSQFIGWSLPPPPPPVTLLLLLFDLHPTEKYSHSQVQFSKLTLMGLNIKRPANFYLCNRNRINYT